MALTNLSQITTSGIATGTDLNIRNITGAAATFTGNVTVGGTLTYEDVTNIDSVGLITARSGINVNSGDVNITSGNLALASATPMVVASNGSGHLRLGAGGSEKVRITSAGLVGIGTTIPGSLLHISGPDASSAKIKIEDNNNGFAASEIGVENGGRDLKIAAPQDIYFEDVDTGVRHLYIESGGNIGINTNNPQGTLDIRSTKATESNFLTLRADRNGANTEVGILFKDRNVVAGIQTAARINSLREGSGGNFSLVFSTSAGSADATEKLRVTSAGIVQVGASHSTGSYGWDPTFKVAVEQGSGDASAIHFGESVNGSANPSINFLRRDGSTLWSAYAGQISYELNKFQFKTAPNAAPGSHSYSTRMTILQDGKVGIGTDNPSSDLQVASYGDHGKIRVESSGNGNRAGIEFFRESSAGTGKGAAGIWVESETGNSTGELRFGTASNASLQSFNTKMILNVNGNLGIGTDNPTDHLQIHHTNAKGLTFKTTESHYAQITADSNRSSADNHLLAIEGHWNGTPVAEIAFKTGNDTTNKDNGEIIFRTAPASNLASNERLRITSGGRVGIGTDVPTSDLHVFRSTATSSIIDAAAGNALLTLRNAGNTNWSGIDFTRERSTGPNVTGGSIWMPSDTSNNSATLYLQTQSASANAGVDGALTDDNGVRLKLASQPGGNGSNSAFTVEVGSTERLRITSAGDLLVNHDSSDGSGKLQVFTNSQDGIDIFGFSSGATGGGRLTFYRSKSVGVGNFSEVANGDSLGRIDWRGHNDDGTANNLGATIEALVSGSVNSTTDMPSDLVFKTSPDGSASPSERVRITSAGSVGIGTNSPDDRLHVLGGNIQIGKIEEAGYETILGNNNLSFNRSAASYINQRGAGDIRFRYGSDLITWMHMEGSSGHIGIATDAPDYRLEVFGPPGTGDLSIKSAASAAGGTEHSKLRFRVRNPSNQESTLASIHVISDANWGGNLTFGTKTASGGLSESTVERVRIKHNGMVGIGTQSYGNIDPLAPLHVCSYAPTTTITDHQHLRNAAQILCQTSNNVNNSKSGIMFSGALHSTDGCSAGIIANHENVAENSETTSLSFYTSYQEVIGERFRIFADGQFDMNGVRHIYETFRLQNNTNYNWDYTVPDEGGYGNSFYLVAGYNHYYTTNYGAHRTVWFSARGTSVGSMGNGIEQYHSQSGSWTFSKPNATTVRITKTAGTYGGQGYGFFRLMYNHF